jgi:hypothetical protein
MRFAAFLLAATALAQTDDARQRLIRELNQIGFLQLKERAAAVARIDTRDAAEERRRDVQSKLRQLIGGLP